MNPANDREPPLVPITWLALAMGAELDDLPHDRECESRYTDANCDCGRNARVARLRMLLRQVERHAGTKEESK